MLRLLQVWQLWYIKRLRIWPQGAWLKSSSIYPSSKNYFNMSNFDDSRSNLFCWNVSLEQFWFVPKKEAVPQSELRRKSIFLPSSPFSHLLFIWRGLSWSSFSLCGGNLFFASFEFRSCLEWIWFAEEWRQPSRTDSRVFFFSSPSSCFNPT